MCKRLATLSAIAILFVASTSNAQVTATDAACRAAVQKNASKLGATTMKTIDTCLKKTELAGSPETDCNDWTVADAAKGKINNISAKVVTGVGKKCAALPPSYPDCPSPGDATDAGAATGGVDDAAELANCEIVLNTDAIEPLRNYILDPDAAAASANSTLVKCANAIAKSATKLWKTVSKTRGKCQTTSDKAGGSYSALVCAGSDDGGKISAAVGKFDSSVDKACGVATGLSDSDLVLLHSCATSLAGIQSCVADAVISNASGLNLFAFEFPGVCPASVRMRVKGNAPVLGIANTATDYDLGWPGFAVNQDVGDEFAMRVQLSGCTGDCSSCTVSASCAEGNCRCSNDPSISCLTPFVGGGPCGAGTCLVHFGPPAPRVAGGAAACAVNTIQSPFVGTMDVGSGEVTTSINTHAKVHLGIAQTQPCPVCTGPTVGAAGTCSGGARNGLACVTDATNATWGNTSYDCPPSPAYNITGAGLKIDLNLTTAASSLPAGDTCDAPLGAFLCFCGACTLDPSTACQNDTDCSGLGLGTCSNAGGVPRQPNQCSDLTCNAGGVCNAGPVDSFCDGKVKGNGDGYITCANNVDCTFVDPLAGNCSLTANRRCFESPITTTGAAGIYEGVLATTFCSGPTTSGGVNSAFGLPGPGRLALDVDYTRICSDGVTEYELGGANCP